MIGSAAMIGRTVALTALDAENKNFQPAKLSGLYFVEDFQPVEPSNYSWSATYILYRADQDPKDDQPMYWWVDACALEEQVDPHGYGRVLAQERECEWAAEDADLLYAEMGGPL